MNGIDVLRRAKKLLEKAPLPDGWNEHGEYCPYCAISLAKGELDEELGTGIGLVDGMKQVLSGKIEEIDSDAPLVDARNLISTLDAPFTKEKTLAAMGLLINA